MTFNLYFCFRIKNRKKKETSEGKIKTQGKDDGQTKGGQGTTPTQLHVASSMTVLIAFFVGVLDTSIKSEPFFIESDSSRSPPSRFWSGED